MDNTESSIISNIESEPNYPADAIQQEDYMQLRLYELAESEIEASSLFSSWILSRRPDTAIFNVEPKPRGYGRI